MAVKKEPSGRRSVQLEIEVPGTPEEVWQAIATAPGISAWLVPAIFDERDGTPVTITLQLGMGIESKSTVTAWHPPTSWSAESDGWGPGAPPIAQEWTVEARGGGTCIVRIVLSHFASSDDWNQQLEGAEYGWTGFLGNLRLYLTHFRGQRSVSAKWMGLAAGSEAEAWEALTAAVGVGGVTVGGRWSAPAGLPASDGIVEYVKECPYDILLRLEHPSPGIAAMGAIDCGGQVMVALSVTLFGDQAERILAREAPRWAAWFHERFPVAPDVAPTG